MSGDTATPLKATVLSERSQSWDTTSDHVGMSSAGRSNEAAQTIAAGTGGKWSREMAYCSGRPLLW